VNQQTDVQTDVLTATHSPHSTVTTGVVGGRGDGSGGASSTEGGERGGGGARDTDGGVPGAFVPRAVAVGVGVGVGVGLGGEGDLATEVLKMKIKLKSALKKPSAAQLLITDGASGRIFVYDYPSHWP